MPERQRQKTDVGLLRPRTGGFRLRRFMLIVRGVRTLTTIRVGTRGSRLAVAQTEGVVKNLKELNPGLETEIIVIKTLGDEITDKPLATVGGKGLFVKEIETALLNNEIDVAVHSLKDLPGELPAGLQITAIPKRLAPFDAFVSSKYRYLSDLPKNAKVGTGSARRKAELLRYRSDLEIVPMRGNVDTRLKKLDDGEADAIILAQAGLERLGLQERIKAVIGMNILLPAAGQGALVLETRSDDNITNMIAEALHDPASAMCVLAERAFMQTLGGDCDIPAAALAEACCGNVILTGAIFSANGHNGFVESVVSSEAASIVGAQKLAQRLLEMGGDKILAELKQANA